MTLPSSPATGAWADVLRKGPPARAVRTGLFVQVGAYLLSSLGLAIAYSLVLAASGVPGEDIARAFYRVRAGMPLDIVLTALQALSALLGGYVCARIVRRDELRVAGVMAALSGGFCLLMGRGGMSYLLATTALLVMATLGGAVLARRRHHKGAVSDPRLE